MAEKKPYIITLSTATVAEALGVCAATARRLRREPGRLKVDQLAELSKVAEASTVAEYARQLIAGTKAQRLSEATK